LTSKKGYTPEIRKNWVRFLSLKDLRNPYIKSMMCSALAQRIIFSLKIFRKRFNIVALYSVKSFSLYFWLLGTFLSYFVAIAFHNVWLLGNLLSYFLVIASSDVLGGTFPSYFSFLLMAVTPATLNLTNFLPEKPIKHTVETYCPADWFDDFGRDGIRVAAYLRVSTGKQAKKGFSLDEQHEQLLKYLESREEVSRVYWFKDAGKSGKNFDRRKLEPILTLKRRGEIDELCIANVDRLGRECRGLLIFFLELCDEGAVIRTPERKYDLKDLSSLLMFAIEAYSAQQENERRTKAAIAGKIQAFKQKHWNKPVPLGYHKTNDGWIKKIPAYSQLIQDIYNLFNKQSKQCYASASKAVNKKFQKLLVNPLTHHQIKRILTDPVYMGKPEHLGVVLSDIRLEYVDVKTFKEAQRGIERIHKSHSKDVSVIRKLVVAQGISVLDFLDKLEYHHKGCGGLLINNGTLSSQGITQQAYLCKKCMSEFRIPTKAQMQRFYKKLSPRNESHGSAHDFSNSVTLQKSVKPVDVKKGSGVLEEFFT